MNSMEKEIQRVRQELRQWVDSHAFRVEIHGKDIVLIPLPEPIDDYIDVQIGKITWPK